MKPLPFWVRLLLWIIGARQGGLGKFEEITESCQSAPSNLDQLMAGAKLQREIQREMLLRQLVAIDMYLGAALGPHRCLAKHPPPGVQ